MKQYSGGGIFEKSFVGFTLWTECSFTFRASAQRRLYKHFCFNYRQNGKKACWKRWIWSYMYKCSFSGGNGYWIVRTLCKNHTVERCNYRSAEKCRWCQRPFDWARGFSNCKACTQTSFSSFSPVYGLLSYENALRDGRKWKAEAYGWGYENYQQSKISAYFLP